MHTFLCKIQFIINYQHYEMKRNESEWKQYRSKHLKTRMMTRLPGLAASRHQAQPPRVHFFMCRRPALLKMSAEQVSERQNMHSYLIVCVLSGEGYFTFRGKRTHASAGACFFIDCMEPYSHESSRDFPWQLIWVHFERSYLKAILSIFHKEFSEFILSGQH